ncbi:MULTISPECIES: hypothetical protein [Streptacidiphilus]|uniref:Uncharacterized protein n=1 Tax=Streptacidiphilus cavernicola TaxID=3342716 RepID=A0ABV6UQX7_9ACTN|nr:hypothetical protein [Streptacidiphilus jeojiense]
MGQARFLIVTRPVSPSVPAGEFAAGARTVWRLLGPNNRELGRGAAGFDTPERCLEAVLRLRADAHRAVVAALRIQPGAMWAWRLSVDDLPVAASGRAYRRQRECQYNLTQFIDAVPLAELPRRKPEFAEAKAVRR